MPVTEQLLQGHQVMEKREAAAERRESLHAYRQVSLQGCHQSLMPRHRLPQTTRNIVPPDEVGMSNDRRTYAWETKYSSNRSVYYKPTKRYGRIALLIFGGDHLQPARPSSYQYADNS